MRLLPKILKSFFLNVIIQNLNFEVLMPTVHNVRHTYFFLKYFSPLIAILTPESHCPEEYSCQI